MASNEDIERMTAEWRRRHDEMERGATYLERGRGQSRPRAEIRAAKSPIPQTLATVLGAEVDPTEEAKKAYRAAANGEVDMPLVTPAMARGIGAGLAGYQGVEAVAGASGLGGVNTSKPPKHSVSGSPVFIAEHGTSVNALRKILDSRTKSFQNPSVAVRLLDKDQLAIGGGRNHVTVVFPRSVVTPGGAKRVNYGNFDIVSSIRSDFISEVRRNFKKATGKDLTKENFRNPSDAEAPYVDAAIEAAYQTLYDADVRDNPSAPTTRDPEKAKAFRDSLVEWVASHGPNIYNEAKVNDDVPLSDAVVLVDRDRSGVGALQQFKNTQRLAEMHGDKFRIPYETLRKERQAQNDLIKDLSHAGVRVIPYGRSEGKTYMDAKEETGLSFIDGVDEDAKGGNTRSDAKGGDTGSEAAVSGTPAPGASVPQGGPRIVINPQVFRDKRDALCVTFNEAIRVVCELNGFEPVSEPTEKQRRFFADTAYANDELQLRRTILARIATLDTSVSDPTDEQLEETAEMLEMVMEVGAPQNEWEQQAVQRLHDVVVKAREGRVQNEETPPPPQDNASTQADVGGGIADDEDEAWGELHKALTASTAGMAEDHAPAAQEPRGPAVGDVRYLEKSGTYVKQTYGEHGWNGQVIQKDEWDAAQKSMQGGASANETAKAWDAGAEDRKQFRERQAAAREGRLATMNLINAGRTDGSIDRRAWLAAKMEQDDRVEHGSVGSWTPEQNLAWYQRDTAKRRSSTAEPGPNQGSVSISPTSESLDVRGAATVVRHATNVSQVVTRATTEAPIVKGIVDLAKAERLGTLTRQGASGIVRHSVGGAAKVGVAAGFAAAGIESAYHGAVDLLSTAKATGASWGDVGNATKDVFTTRQGWKNPGWGLLGATHDVLGSMTFGALGDGDRWRNRMR